MILAGSLMLPDPIAGVRLARGWLRVEGDRIAEVREGQCPHGVDLGGDGCVVTPGFIDAHVHLPQFDAIGIDGLSLLDWLDRAVYPAEMRWADADFAADMTRRVIDRMTCHGTTGFAGYASVHHAATRAAMRVARDMGVRAAIGQVLMDRHAPAELLRPADRLLDEVASLFPADADGDARVQPAVNPRFAITCSPELLQGAGALARVHAAVVQTHLAETLAETSRVAELHGGVRYTDVYDRAGLLTPRTLLAHAVHLDASDLAKIADAGAVIAHCPTANTFLQAGAMNRHAALAAGVRVALGSDVAGGPDVAMPRVARAMIDTAKLIMQHAPMAPDTTDRAGHHHPHHPASPPTPAAAWLQITAANADALGWHQSGRIFGGADADLLVIRPDLGVELSAHADPLGLLLYAWDDRWLTHTIIGGHVRACR